MSQAFIANFLHVVRQVTQAERCMAVDMALAPIERLAVDDSLLKAGAFIELAERTLRDAMQRGETIITNNVIADMSQAPVTNTNFADLRIVVAFPLPTLGAIYLDRHIRYGVIARDVIEKLRLLAQRLITDGILALESDEMYALYQQA